MRLAFLALFPSVAMAAPTLTLDGDCPGPVDVTLGALTPGGAAMVIASAGPGSFVIPSGACAGVDIGLAAPTRWFGRLVDHDGDGTIAMSPTVPVGACAQSMVAFDMATCTVSPPTTWGDGGPGATVPGEFNAPLPDTLGGQRVFAPDGTLWYLSYVGALYSVPPGGGPATAHVTDDEVGANGFGGTPFVDADGTILFESGGSGIVRYDPPSDTWETIADTTVDYYGVSQLFRDIDGNLVTGRPQQVVRPDGSFADVPFLRDYIVNTPEWVYTLESGNVHRRRHDGSEESVWGTGCTDGYGLARGVDGSLFCSQGNTQPAAVHQIPPDGGAALVVGYVPSAVLFVATHPVTGKVYLAGYGVGGNDVFEFDPVTGESVLYGDAP